MIDLKPHRIKDDRYFFGGNRETVIQRDGERCVNCGLSRDEHKERYGKDITVDHIDRRGKNVPTAQKNNDLNNLQTLCLPCHGRKSYMDNGAPKSTHGMPSMYTNHGCRCDSCRAAWAASMKKYKAKRKLSLQG
jgi:HNH endonuclease